MDKHDEDLLLLVAAHEAVVAEQAAGLVKLELGGVEQRLDRLRAQGLMSRRRLSGRSPAVYRITPEGAALVDGTLPELAPFDWQRYRHQLGVAWLWVAAKHGVFGNNREVLSFREMVAADVSLRTRSLLRADAATFVTDADGDLPERDVLHPDLAFVLTQDVWVAMWLVTGHPDLERLEPAIMRYGNDPLLYRMIVILEYKERDGQLIVDLAEQLGFADKVGPEGFVEIDGG